MFLARLGSEIQIEPLLVDSRTGDASEFFPIKQAVAMMAQ